VGLYLGGAVGQSRVEATTLEYGSEEFRESHSAFKVMVGIRPISLVGAELAYIHFGDPAGSLGFQPADVNMKGAAAFGIVYLPVPVVDIYLKAGVARIDSTVNGANPFNCGYICGSNLFRLERTDTHFAEGVGTQYKFGAWAVRVEYERFDAAGGNPSLLSAGVTWTFL